MLYRRVVFKNTRIRLCLRNCSEFHSITPTSILGRQILNRNAGFRYRDTFKIDDKSMTVIIDANELSVVFTECSLDPFEAKKGRSIWIASQSECDDILNVLTAGEA